MIHSFVDYLKAHRKTLTSLASILVSLAAAVALFGVIADEVTEGDTLPYDDAILLAINSWSSPVLDAITLVVTEFGGSIAVSIIVLILCSLLARRKKWRGLTFVLVSMIGMLLLNLSLKLLFARDRPDLWAQLITEDSFSFPSGHAMASSALAAVAILLSWHTKWRSFVITGGLIYVLAIGFTRLYLGVHYPTDIIAGWGVSIAWVSISYAMLLFPSKLKSKR